MLFSQNELKLLTTPAAWRIVTTLFPAEAPEAEDDAHRSWRNQPGNTEFHTFPEAVFVLEGDALLSLNEQTFRAAPGTLFFFNRRDLHDCAYPENCGSFTHLWLSFAPEAVFARQIAVRGPGGMLRGQAEVLENPELATVLLNTFTRLPESQLSPRLRREKFAALFELLFLEFAEPGEQTQPPRGDYPERIVGAAVKHIRCTVGRGISIEKLAQMAGYAKSHFFRLFKIHTGMTIHAYIDMVRLERAAELAEAGRRGKEIADELGFSSPSAYSHWLRRKERQ